MTMQLTGAGGGAAPRQRPRQRVVVLDGSATVTLLICSLLRRWGHDAVAGSADPVGLCDLLIADPAMLDGHHASLRHGGPWLALVSDGDAHSGADAAGWVHKPIEPEALRAAVTRCLNGSGGQSAGGIDTDAIAASWGSVDNAGFRRVAAAFLAEMEQNLVALAQALASQDRRRLQLEAHSVVGAAANVGGTAMAEAARALETAALQADFAGLAQLVEVLATVSRRDLPALKAIAERD